MINIEYTNEVLEDICKKKEYNKQYSKFYYRMFQLYGKPKYSERYYNKSERINDCMNLWLWDAYHQNKILDLQKVNRCKDNRFCPNCRKYSLASAVHNFGPHFRELLYKGYYPYLLTLTVPNVPGEQLKDTIDKLNESFRKFFRKLSFPVGKNQPGFKDRFIQFDAALKVLEITYNQQRNTYHPHFHVMVFSQEYDKTIFDKTIPGPWSNKRQCQDFNSLLDIHLMKLWKMCFDGITITSKKFDYMSNDWSDLYLCDIREMDDKGIYEVMKYTFKDTDIPNYKVFETFVFALECKRLRQGYGLLYNVKVEEEADGEGQELELETKENPEQLLTREIKELITVYHDYRKVSRYGSKELNDVLSQID